MLLRQCSCKMWLLACLSSLALVVPFYSSPILDMAYAVPISQTSDWQWVRSQQQRLRKSAKLSRQLWPIPKKWVPQYDFAQIVELKDAARMEAARDDAAKNRTPGYYHEDWLQIQPYRNPSAGLRLFHRIPETQPRTADVRVNHAKNLWLYCASQWNECACYGKVRWGNAGSWQAAGSLLKITSGLSIGKSSA